MKAEITGTPVGPSTLFTYEDKDRFGLEVRITVGMSGWKLHRDGVLVADLRGAVMTNPDDAEAILAMRTEPLPLVRFVVSGFVNVMDEEHLLSPFLIKEGDGVITTPCSMPVHSIAREARPGTALLEQHRKELAQARNEGLVAVESVASDLAHEAERHDPDEYGAVAAAYRKMEAVCRAQRSPEGPLREDGAALSRRIVELDAEGRAARDALSAIWALVGGMSDPASIAKSVAGKITQAKLDGEEEAQRNASDDSARYDQDR